MWRFNGWALAIGIPAAVALAVLLGPLILAAMLVLTCILLIRELVRAVKRSSGQGRSRSVNPTAEFERIRDRVISDAPVANREALARWYAVAIPAWQIRDKRTFDYAIKHIDALRQ